MYSHIVLLFRKVNRWEFNLRFSIHLKVVASFLFSIISSMETEKIFIVIIIIIIRMNGKSFHVFTVLLAK